MTSESSPKTISFGLLLIPDYQLLDASGPMDYINNHGNLALLGFLDRTGRLAKKAPTIDWHFISTEGTLDPIRATSGPLQIPTATFDTCPPLDYLLVPGPDPRFVFSEACIAFIQKRFEEVKGLLTVCTGSLVLAQTGILNGLQVASNKMALKEMVARGITPDKRVNWVKDKRFVVDGKVWSSAGITAGIDLAAEWVRVQFDPEIVQISQDAAEYSPNPAQPDPFARILEGVILK